MSDKAENRPIATVAVERTFFNLDSDYDYAVPPALADRVRPGVAVEVPFGSGNRLRRGIVLQVFVGINPALKDIARVCDYGTVLDESQIRLARWMKNRYFCTTYECLLQMLPRGFGKIGVAGVRMAELTVSHGEELPRLTPKQQSVADLLLDIGSATVEEIKTLCGVGDGVLKNMEKCGVLRFSKKRSTEIRTRICLLPPRRRRSNCLPNRQRRTTRYPICWMVMAAARYCTALPAAARPRYICA